MSNLVAVKIAINTRFLLPNKIEGIGRVTYEIVKRIIEKHPENEYHFLFDRPFNNSYLFQKTVTGHSIFPPTRHPILTHSWLQIGVRKFLQKNNPDVYLSFDGHTPLKSKVPSIITIHDLAYLHYPEQNRWADRKYYQTQMPRFVKQADHIITVSAFSKMDICSAFQLSEDKVSAIYNGVGLEFTPLSENNKLEVRKQYSEGKPYFLYLGAIHPRKNVAGLIRAFDIYKKQNTSDVKLLIAGRLAWLSKSVKNTMEQTTHRKDIIFTDYILEKDLPQLIGAADVLCYLSLFEGFGLPIVEAMSSGVPVICSNRNAMKEIGGKAAELVNPENYAEIANAMHHVYSNVEKRQKMIAAGLKRGVDFNWDQAAEKYYRVIQKVTKST